MPYRDAGIDEFCAVCAVATRRSCRRCQRPCCEAHVRGRGDCTPCDVSRRERSSLRVVRSGFVAVGASASALLLAAMIGSGMTVVVAVAGIAVMLVATAVDDRRRALLYGQRQLPPATLRRP